MVCLSHRLTISKNSDTDQPKKQLLLVVHTVVHCVYYLINYRYLNDILKQAIHTLVLGLIALLSLLKSVTSTNDISIPIWVATTLEKYLLVPNNKITMIIPVIKFTKNHINLVLSNELTM